MRPRRDVRRGTRVAAALAVLGALTTACVEETTAVSCVSWAGFADEASRTQQADVVVDAVVHGRAGEREMFGIQAAVWEAEVTAVHKGDVTAGDRIEVASTPITCTEQVYPHGDPLDVDGAVRLYLADTDFGVQDTGSGLALITPDDGVGRPASSSAAPADGGR